MPIKLNTGKTIKSHEDLGITFPEWAALFGVALALHDGLIAMHKLDNDDPPNTHVFNLKLSCEPNGHCGTVGCIGGYVGLAMGKSVTSAHKYVYGCDRMDDRRRKLYFPSGTYSYDRITPRQAAAAICNFLTTGEPKWQSVVRNPKYKPLPRRVDVKEHQSLGITFPQWLALLSVRAMLDVGALVYDGKSRVEPKVHKFNMALGATEYYCGTVGCIGGYVGMINGLTAHEASDFVRSSRHNPGLSALFFPRYRGMECSYAGLTPAQAVRAIDNYLSPGGPRWHKVLGTGHEVWCW